MGQPEMRKVYARLVSLDGLEMTIIIPHTVGEIVRPFKSAPTGSRRYVLKKHLNVDRKDGVVSETLLYEEEP